MSLSLYWRRRWDDLRSPPYVARQLTGEHIVARQRREARAKRRKARLNAAIEWLRIRAVSMAATAGIVGTAAVLTVYVSKQPVIDQLAEDNIELARKVDEWRDTAQRSARGEYTINLKGQYADVQKNVKRIAADMAP